MTLLQFILGNTWDNRQWPMMLPTEAQNHRKMADFMLPCDRALEILITL